MVLIPIRTKSDGGSTDYYDIPQDAIDISDLIEHRRMSFGVGNIFKACYRLGRKSGIDDAYDLRKIIHFATRELQYVERRGQRKASTATPQPYCERLADTEIQTDSGAAAFEGGRRYASNTALRPTTFDTGWP